MKISSETVIFPLVLCLSVGWGHRIKRQIVFEDGEQRSRVIESDCITPQGVPGTCLTFTDCPTLRRLNWYRMRPYLCGFAGQEPRVCCPDFNRDDNDFWSTTSTRRTTPTFRRTTSTTRRTTTSQPRVVPTTGRATTRRTTTLRPTTTTKKTTIGNLQRPRTLPERCGDSPIVKKTNVRVVGGEEAERDAWPWMSVVFVQKRNGIKSPDCGGALVTDRHVITAAHCIVTGRAAATLNPRMLSVRLGAHDLRVAEEPGSVEVPVESIRRHERFDPRTYKNDIAVLKLAWTVQFDPLIGPVCLPYNGQFEQDNIAGKTSFVTGFGTTEFNGPASDVLMQVSFDVSDQDTCRSAYEKELNITNEYLCAGTADGSKDSCQGDSGGPLVTLGFGDFRFYLIGVVSFGKLCAQPGYPGVYTRVTHYLDWLRGNLAD